MAIVTETDDAPASADTPYEITLDDSFLGTIDPLADRDWVGIDLDVGRSYRFLVTRDGDPGSGLPDPLLVLFGPDGEQVALDDDSAGDLLPRLDFIPDVTGRFHLAVQAFSDASVGEYRLDAFAQPAEDEDAPVSLDTPYTVDPELGFAGALTEDDEGDAIGVEVEAGVSYRFEVSGVTDGALFDPILTLFDEDGTLIGEDDDGGRGLNAALSVTAKEDGKIFMLVGTTDLVDPTGNYQVQVTEFGSRFVSIDGNGGSDSLSGGPGRQEINGGGGDDILRGGRGDDSVNGGGGNDRTIGGSGNDDMAGGGGADTALGGEGFDTLGGGRGSDRLLGGNQGDILNGDGGDDVLLGGRGRDVLIGGSGDDDITSGPGADQIRFGLRDGSDVVNDFNPATDTLLLDDALWGEADLSIEEVFERYAAEFAVGILPDGPVPEVTGGVSFFFKGGEIITLNNATLMDETLADAIEIV